MNINGIDQSRGLGRPSHRKPVYAAALVVLLVAAVALLFGTFAFVGQASATTITFAAEELLGRPTNNSVTINIVPGSTIEYYYRYGTASGGPYTGETAHVTATGGQPHEVVITGLSSNTHYYYQMVYDGDGDVDDGDSETRTQRSFWTQRAPGQEFTFDVTSDSHVNIMLGSAATWTQTMTNVAADNADFLIDLGDTFAMDSVTNVSGAESAYLDQREFFDLVGHSASIFLAVGNHEQQEGWHLDDTGNPATSTPVMGTNAQKKYYLNPVPSAFYTGNSDTSAYLDGDQLHEDYYAWTWGDALFMVIDPYWYTTTKPFTGNTGGGETSDAGSGDRWDWTLGQTQFNWLKATLEASSAKYKFILAHHYVGGSDDYVRGGANPAHICEWGGNNEDGTTYAWLTRRAGWGSDPVHQILVDNNVSAFFHGHDHQYGYEARDGVVYVSMPSAGFSGNGFGLYTTGSGYTIQALPSPGHLRVTVGSDETTAQYIATTGGTVNHTFTIEPNAVSSYTLTYTAGANGTISGTSPQTVAPGGSGTAVTAVPNANYHFVQWSDGVLTATRTDTNVMANITVTAQFAINTYTLTYTAGAGGTITGTSPQTVNHGASGTAVTAVPNANYHFVQWSDGVLTATRTDTNVMADITVTAQFASDSYTLAYTAGTGGTISGVSPQTVAPGGSGTAVTATPSVGYHFVQWSDGVLTATRTDTNVLADITVTAQFAINTYTLTYTAGAGGTITGVSPQTVPYGASGTAVTAVPNSGFHFVQWSDGLATASRTDANVTADVTVTATFAANAIVYTSIRGSHRYHTAQLVSQAMFAGALPAGAGVVLAPGETFQEALCGAPLAAAYGGPVLLTPTVGLENGTRAELIRLAPSYVFVIGLSSAITTAVQTALPAATVIAINGANVYQMSNMVAEALDVKVGDMSGATAIITIGTNFPDAIGVSPLACANLWPVILTDSPTNAALHAQAADALTSLGITKAIKAGTYATLPGTVAGLANLSGADRYVTNTNVAAWAKANAGLSFVHTGIATGDKFPDALASGPYLGKDDGILLLSPLLGPLPPSIGALITANAAAVQHVTFIAMIEPVISQVKALLP